MTAQETNLVNAFETTLAAQLAAGGTTMNLTDNPGIDSKAYFVIDPDSSSNREVVFWSTGTEHGAATVTRDMDGKHGTAEDASTAPTHAAGTKVRLAVVKQHIQDVHDRIEDIALTGDVTGTLASATQDVATTIAATAVHGSMLNTDVISAQTELASGLALTDELLVSDAGTVKRMAVDLIADAIDGGGIDVSSGTLVNAAIGKQSMWIPATAMYPTNSGGCAAIALTETTGAKPDMYTLDFDGTVDENAQFSIAFPSYWNENTINFQVFWTTTATDTDSVDWELAAVSVVDSGTIDVAFGTAVSVTDNVISAAEDLYVSTVSGNLTVASAAANALTFFNIERDAGSDTMAEDAKLIGIKLFYTVDDVHEA